MNLWVFIYDMGIGIIFGIIIGQYKGDTISIVNCVLWGMILMLWCCLRMVGIFKKYEILFKNGKILKISGRFNMKSFVNNNENIVCVYVKGKYTIPYLPMKFIYGYKYDDELTRVYNDYFERAGEQIEGINLNSKVQRALINLCLINNERIE